MQANDYTFEIEDEGFLAELEAVEAFAISNKRRKMSPVAPTLSNPKQVGIGGGLYTAALRGNETILSSQRIVSPSSSFRGSVAKEGIKVVATEGRNGDVSFGSSSYCFKCGKPGHWARDCVDTGGSGGAGFSNNLGNDDNVPEKACPCGLGICLVLTANTEKNRGRKFYKCPTREENGGCGFFEWCDITSGANYITGGNLSHATNSSFPNIACPCGAGSCLILTAKTGENVGQQFYRCPANQGNSCGFFKWCNEKTASGGTSLNAAYGSSYVGEKNKSYNLGSGSTCFKCGKVGHWAKDCTGSSSGLPAEMGGRAAPSGTCYKCNKVGHWARSCPGNV